MHPSTIDSARRERRVRKELDDIAKDDKCGARIVTVDQDLRHMVAVIKGPADSPYQDGNFQLDIDVPETYPQLPYIITFITKVYHPNISSSSGAISLDVLRDQWCPVLTLCTILLSIRGLLDTPYPDEPLDAEIANQFIHSREEFDQTARQWTKEHACGSFWGS